MVFSHSPLKRPWHLILISLYSMKALIFHRFLYMFHCNGPWYLIPTHYATLNFYMVFCTTTAHGIYSLFTMKPLMFIGFCAFSVAAARAKHDHVSKKLPTILAMLVIGPSGAFGPLGILFVILSQKVCDMIALQRYTL